MFFASQNEFRVYARKRGTQKAVSAAIERIIRRTVHNVTGLRINYSANWVKWHAYSFGNGNPPHVSSSTIQAANPSMHLFRSGKV
jgi:hypothetical protein